MKKRILSIILCMALLLTVLFSVPFSVNAESTKVDTEVAENIDKTESCDTAKESVKKQTITEERIDKADIADVGASYYHIEYEGVRYGKYDDSTLGIVGYNPDTLPEHVVIPSSIEGMSVIGVNGRDRHSPFANANLKSIVLPPTVTYIGWYSFYLCYYLESITIQGEVKEIQSHTFEYCNKLAEINLPDSITYIGSEAFQHCVSLKSIELPKNLKNIGEFAFSECESLEKVIIDPALEKIGRGAFCKLESLTDVVFEGKNTNLELDAAAFSGCSNLVNFDFSCIKSIGEGAFSRCTGFKNLDFGAMESLTLGVSAFSYCKSLETVTLSDNMLAIPDNCFLECTRLKDVAMPNVTSIGSGAFEKCSSLESVDLTKTKASVLGENAFKECINLKEITFSDEVTYTMGDAIFEKCTSLKTVKLPSTLTKLPSSCFHDCTALESVEAASLISLGYQAFGGCKNLNELSFAKDNNIKSVGQSAFSSCVSLTEISLPYVETIYDSAFGNCENLYKVELGEHLTKIGEFAFSRCYSLTEVYLPAIKTIDEYAFEYCYSLSKVTIGERLERIGKNAFYNCYSLFEFYIPESVKEIGPYAIGCFDYNGGIYTDPDFVVLGSAASLADEYAQAYMLTWGNGYPAPKLNTISNTSDGIKLTFEKLSGASGQYRIYRKTADTTWTSIANITSNTYTDKTALAGVYYIYTVKFIGYDGTESRYDKNGLSITRLVTPKVTKIQNTEKGAKLTIEKVEGASYYRVYYKTSDGWKGIDNTDTTTFVHESAKSGESYTYTVKAFDEFDNSSSFNSNGWSNTFIATPVISSITSTEKGVKITWDKIDGAVNYRVYYKNGSDWKGIGNTTSTTFTHTDATPGVKYTYTVRCMKSDGKTAVSDYSKQGKSHTYFYRGSMASMHKAMQNIKSNNSAIEPAQKSSSALKPQAIKSALVASVKQATQQLYSKLLSFAKR
ncbi:MAG: leucine-rich repeat protein [Ruminococcus sp.]|nr:leucine-rich repeat protein [Ruminococcus sp.]